MFLLVSIPVNYSELPVPTRDDEPLAELSAYSFLQARSQVSAGRASSAMPTDFFEDAVETSQRQDRTVPPLAPSFTQSYTAPFDAGADSVPLPREYVPPPREPSSLVVFRASSPQDDARRMSLAGTGSHLAGEDAEPIRQAFSGGFGVQPRTWQAPPPAAASRAKAAPERPIRTQHASSPSAPAQPEPLQFAQHQSRSEASLRASSQPPVQQAAMQPAPRQAAHPALQQATQPEPLQLVQQPANNPFGIPESTLPAISMLKDPAANAEDFFNMQGDIAGKEQLQHVREGQASGRGAPIWQQGGEAGPGGAAGIMPSLSQIGAQTTQGSQNSVQLEAPPASHGHSMSEYLSGAGELGEEMVPFPEPALAKMAFAAKTPEVVQAEKTLEVEADKASKAEIQAREAFGRLKAAAYQSANMTRHRLIEEEKLHTYLRRAQLLTDANRYKATLEERSSAKAQEDATYERTVHLAGAAADRERLLTELADKQMMDEYNKLQAVIKEQSQAEKDAYQRYLAEKNRAERTQNELVERLSHKLAEAGTAEGVAFAAKKLREATTGAEERQKAEDEQKALDFQAYLRRADAAALGPPPSFSKRCDGCPLQQQPMTQLEQVIPQQPQLFRQQTPQQIVQYQQEQQQQQQQQQYQQQYPHESQQFPQRVSPQVVQQVPGQTQNLFQQLLQLLPKQQH